MRKLLCGVAFAVFVSSAGAASAFSLKQAVAIAVDGNPEIGQAIANREATEFELQQALGLYAPRVDLQASVGVERLDNPSRRALGIQNNALKPSQVGVVATLDLYDGGFRQAESNRQAARVDGASFRVLERSEFIGLEVARQYFQVILQAQVLGLAQQNVQFHQTTLSNVTDAIGSGKLTDADKQQAVERLSEAEAKVSEAKEALENARITFNKLVGAMPSGATLPPEVPSKALPPTLVAALGLARERNPKVHMAESDVDAAAQVVEKSKAGLAPTVALEGRAQVGNDINGVEDYTTDLQANLTLKWNVFDGGIQQAQVQENDRRETESMLARQQTLSEVEESVRTAWELMKSQGTLSAQYKSQLDASNSLVSSYRDQFGVGQRSLLDVLDAQNTRFNVQVLYETSSISRRFSQYLLLASTGGLLSYLKIDPPKQSDAYARQMLGTPPADSYEPRTLQKLDLTGPVDLTKFVN